MRGSYVRDVQRIIERNARAEFDAIWRAHEETGRPRAVLSDELSNRINELNVKLMDSILFDDARIRINVIRLAIPPTLLKLLGEEELLKRLPQR